MEAKEVKAFFERVAGDWDAMRLAYYYERVSECNGSHEERAGQHNRRDP